MSTDFPTTKSLVILPFRFHPKGEIFDATLGESLADSLAARLFAVEGLSIRPTSSVRHLLAKQQDSFDLGESLQVDYILEGSIFPAAERTRFTVQLLNIPERSVAWGAQFDETETDAFQLEDRVSERIARAVLPYLETAGREPITDSVPVQNTDEMAVEEPSPLEEAKTLTLPQEMQPKNSFKRFAPAGLLILAALLGGFFFWRASVSENKFSGGVKTPTILVLPFQNQGGSSIDNSLGVGLAETLTGNLGNIKSLFVLSANAGRDAARTGQPAHQIGRMFNADYLLRGNIHHIGSHQQIKADVELVKTSNGNILWNKSFEVQDDDINSLQAQITKAVLETLSIRISEPERQKISKRNTNNGLAYELYLIGRYQMASRSPEGLNRAIAAFSQALEKDSNFALAYVGLADAYALKNLYEHPPPPDAYQKAKENVLRALELDENLAEAHATLAYISFYAERNRKESESGFRKAIELNPSYATTHHWFAMTLSATGRHEEALAEIELAQRLDPRSTIILTAKGMLHFYARQQREAINECEKALAIDSGFVPAHKTIRWIFQATGNYAGASDAFQKERSFSGSIDAPGWLVIESQVESTGENFEKARAVLEKALASDYVKNNPKAMAYEIALAYAGLNDGEKTLEWLETAEALDNHSFNFIEIDPRLDKFRNEGRFTALIKKLQNSKK